VDDLKANTLQNSENPNYQGQTLQSSNMPEAAHGTDEGNSTALGTLKPVDGHMASLQNQTIPNDSMTISHHPIGGQESIDPVDHTNHTTLAYQVIPEVEMENDASFVGAGG